MKILVVGGSTLGVTVSAILDRIPGVQFDGFVDDKPEGLPDIAKKNYWGRVRDLNSYSIGSGKIAIAVGSNANRQEIFSRIDIAGLSESIATIVDPGAVLLGQVNLSRGCIVLPGAVVCPGTCVGEGVILNSNSFIGGFCSIGAFSNLCPGASIGSSVTLGELVYVGMGVNVLQGLKVASGAILGAGAVVVRDVERSGVFSGMPAKEQMRF